MEKVQRHGLAFGSPPKTDISLLTHEIHPMVGGIAAGCGGPAPLNVIAFKIPTVSLEWRPPCGFVVAVTTDINCMSCLVVISAQPRSSSGPFTDFFFSSTLRYDSNRYTAGP